MVPEELEEEDKRELNQLMVQSSAALKWGNEFLKKRMGPGSNSEISPEAMRRMERVKKLTKMMEKMAYGVLFGVVKVSGFFTSSIVNSRVGKKFFSLLPGEIVLASLDGFSRVCDTI
nr:protein early-responsive to dehydration 7, chloroplastic [Quercus suber]